MTDGFHTIRSAIAENPCYAYLMALFYRTGVMGDHKLLHCGNVDFQIFFLFCDLDLDPMTFIYDLDLYSLEIHHHHHVRVASEGRCVTLYTMVAKNG